MKSICIKTNNTILIDYILNELNNFNLDDVYYVCKKFKSYSNIIIHYKGNNYESFYTEISTLLSYLVIDNFNEFFLKKIMEKEYFYFNKKEISKVINICFDILSKHNDFSIDNQYLLLFSSFYDYLIINKKIYLTGFIFFRLKKYIFFLESVITTAVNKFIIEREYVEFVSLLKKYIKENSFSSNVVHLIYKNSNISLLDESYNQINVKDFNLNNKYLSDISFSSNDYILNALLNILPNKIIVHLDNNNIDEFINTLSLIFENKVCFYNNSTTN